MGKNINIYLDDQSSFALEEIKKKDPDFNVSNFLQSKLLQVDEKQDDTHVLAMEIEKKHAQIEQFKIEIELLEDQKAKLEAKRKLEYEEKEQEKIKLERKKVEFIKDYSNNLLFYFDISKENALALAEDQWDTPKELRQSIFSVGKDRGLKENKNENK